MKTKQIILITMLVVVFIFGSNAQTFTNYTTNNSGLINDGINKIVIDKMGNKWLGTQNGLSKFDGTNWTNYTTTNNYALTEITSFAVDSLGNKWIGSYTKGLVKFDGTNWINYDTTNGLPNMCVLSIAVDYQHNIWVSTMHGISKFNGVNWITYYHFEFFTDIAVEPRGNHSIWFTSIDTILKYDGNNWFPYSYSEINTGCAPAGGYFIAIDLENNIWFYEGGSNWSAMRYNGVDWKVYFDSIHLQHCVAVDEFNNIWSPCSTYIYGISAISKYKDTTWTYYTCGNNVLASQFQTMAIDSMGNKWFGSNGYGLWKMDCFLPSTPATITGPNIVNIGQGFVTYKAPPIDYATNYVWTFPNGFTGTSTSDSITVNVGTNAVSGNINVYGHSKCGNGNPASLNVTVTLTGINEESQATTYLNISPNPTKDKLTIETNSNTNKSLEITNLIGQTIYTSTVNKKKTIDVSSFPKGIYIIKVNNVAKKFVKE